MGFFDDVVDTITGHAGRRKARNAVTAASEEARGAIKSGTQTAKQELRTGFGAARGNVQRGFGEARQLYRGPEMVQTRQQLMQRILGQGGIPQEQIGQMKAESQESFGTALRAAERIARSGFGGAFGDSQAPGMATENAMRFARGATADLISQNRALDLRNAELARQEAMQSIPLMMESLQQEAGLSTQEAALLANLAQSEGISLAGLTAQEAQFLANIAMGQGGAIAGMQNTQGWIGPLLESGSSLAAAAILAGSSREFKEDIRPIHEDDYARAVKKLRQLKLYQFRFKGQPHTFQGVITEDPTTPHEIKAPDNRHLIMYSFLTWVVKAMKGLAEEVAELRKKVGS